MIARQTDLQTTIQHVLLGKSRECQVECSLVQGEFRYIDGVTVTVEEYDGLLLQTEHLENATQQHRGFVANTLELKLDLCEKGVQSDGRLLVFLFQGSGSGGKLGYGRCCWSALLRG